MPKLISWSDANEDNKIAPEDRTIVYTEQKDVTTKFTISSARRVLENIDNKIAELQNEKIKVQAMIDESLEALTPN